MLKKWINNFRSANTNEKLKVTSDGDYLLELNLKKALEAHDAWKVKLNNELMGNAETPIDLTVVASDCKCVLGKWLHGAGKAKLYKLPEYKKALNAHANFHFSAAEVVIEHRSGNTRQAQVLLTTKFRSASNLNQLELVRLFTVANQ